MATECEAKVIDVIQQTYNVKSVRLAVKEKVSFEAGQYLMVTVKIPEAVSKPLSISSSPTEAGYIEFTKKLTGSEFSQAIDKLKAGDTIRVKYPFGKFIYTDNYPKLAFLSGGIGITPIRSLCKYIVDKKVGTDVVMLYGNSESKDIVFKEDFDRMVKQHPKLKVVYVLCKPESGWAGKTGYINDQLIKEEMPDYKDRRFYFCGPPAMVKALINEVTNVLALSKEDIVTEHFVGYEGGGEVCQP